MKERTLLATFRQQLQRPVNEQQLLRLGHFSMFVMLLLSLYYYRERMLHFDTANYAFNVIVYEDFYTGFERYISYVYQLLPLLLIKLGASLPVVLMGYSASYVLVFWLVYWLVSHAFDNRIVGLWLVFALTLTIRYKFYAPVGEVVNSIPLIALVFGWMSRPAERFAKLPAWLDVGIGIGLGSLLLSGHPFIVVSTAVVFGFHLFWNKQWANPRFWLTAFGVAALLAWSFWPSGGQANYEAERVGRLANMWALLTNPGDFYITDLLQRYWRRQYVLPTLILLILLLDIGRQKRWLGGLYSLLSLLAMLILVASLHSYLGRPTYLMIDGYMTHLGLVFALPLVFHWGRTQRFWQFLLLVLLAGYSLHRIHAVSPYFTNREAIVQELVEKNTTAEEPKALIDYDVDLSFEQMWMDWALPYESLLLSSLDGPQASRTVDVYYPHDDQWGSHFDDPNFFIGAGWLPAGYLNADELPKRYFYLRPSLYRKPATFVGD
ncbi:MAG: hypothetical protein AAF433_04150 [Bacteroidota bacterium]